jgi:hypothetical protein
VADASAAVGPAVGAPSARARLHIGSGGLDASHAPHDRAGDRVGADDVVAALDQLAQLVNSLLTVEVHRDMFGRPRTVHNRVEAPNRHALTTSTPANAR